MPIAFDARHLSNNKRYEVQRTNHFEVIIPGFGEDFTLAVTRCALPEITVGVTELPYGNSKVKVAGSVEYGDGSIDVYDFITADFEQTLLDWQAKVYNRETGQIGWAADYKMDLQVNQFGPDGSYVRTWVLEGAWPTTLSFGELDATNADAKKVSLTIAYDRAIRQ